VSAVLDGVELLACPRDRSPLELRDETLVCAEGHEYPMVDGAPVLVHPDLAPMQLGYWATPEEVERARDHARASPQEAVDPYVAGLIVATHGNLYRGVGPLRRYPIPAFPLTGRRGARLLDVGCNWGRWSIAAARAGFSVVGVDPSVEAIAAATRVARQLGEEASYAVGDARRLPFFDGAFEVVFSFSVLQHFDPAAFEEAVDEIGRVLVPGGLALIQMANVYGPRNLLNLALGRRPRNPFDVLYRRPSELERSFGRIGDVSLAPQGFLTLNAQGADLDLLPRRARAVVRTSEALRRVGAPARVADSVWVSVQKR
jgi:SAM-dependent methyltransferase